MRSTPSQAGHPLPAMVRRVFRVDRQEIGYLRFTLESYDGMAQVGTLDPRAALIQVFMPTECQHTVMELLRALREEEGLLIEPL